LELLHTNAGQPGFLPDALTPAGSKTRQGFANGFVAQGLARLDWNGDLYPAFSDQPHFLLDWLDLDSAIPRQNQPSRSIHV
jgi:hypothetical protein